MMPFRTQLGRDVWKSKYDRENRFETWKDHAKMIVDDVCGARVAGPKATTTPLVNVGARNKIGTNISTMKYMPGGRYIYYAGRPASFFNNCYMFKLESDTREAWSDLVWRNMSALMTGGGTGSDLSVARGEGKLLSRTGGVASGPLPLAYTLNEVGRNVMQGGSRRSALYASLDWQHDDIGRWLIAKNWHNIPIIGAREPLNEWFMVSDAKEWNVDYHAPLDMMNISVNYDDDWYNSPGAAENPTFQENVLQALLTGEPGFSFNFGLYSEEKLRNACTEAVSSDDSDNCNLGSVNMSRIDTLEEFYSVCYYAAQFQICGSLRADVPFQKVADVVAKNRRIGVGLMGIHEWLLKRGYKYEMVPELRDWLEVYVRATQQGADNLCIKLNINIPVAYRAIAPTGTISMMAGTTGGAEPLYATAYLRRYLKNDKWQEVPMIDGTAQTLIDGYGLEPENIETALDLSHDVERRLKFQAELQEFVDQAISSTINLPSAARLTDVTAMATLIHKYAPRLRGLTFYPDGARGGQPLTSIPYREAMQLAASTEMNDSCKSGVCGV